MRRALLLAYLLMLASPVQAQLREAALLSPRVAEGLPEGTAWQLIAALVDELAQRGYEARLPSTVNTQLEPLLRPCSDPQCAVTIKRALEIDSVVLVQASRDPRGEHVRVTFVDDKEQAYAAEASATGDRPLHLCATLALRRALAAKHRGPGPWLSVKGAPQGAEVLVDDNPVGTVPTLVAIAPGARQIAVRAPDHDTFSEQHDIPADIAQLIELQVTLKKHTARAYADDVYMDQGPELDADGGGLDWNLVTGTAAIAAGALLLIKPALTLARSGDCAEEVAGQCTRTYRFAGAAIWHTAIGGALVGTGIALFIARPFSVSADVATDHAHLHVSGTF